MQVLPQNFSIGDMAVVGTLLVSMLSYHRSRRRENRQALEASEKLLREQERMHSQNKQRLDALLEFRQAQELVNRKRDEQIANLSTICATFSELARGMNRRLEIVEDARTKRGRAS